MSALFDWLLHNNFRTLHKVKENGKINMEHKG